MDLKSWPLLSVATLLCLLLPSCASRGPSWVVQPAHKGTVLVIGTVAKQGAVAWNPGITARQCLLKACGTTQFANVRRVRVFTAKSAKAWQGTAMIEQTIDLRLNKPDIEVPDQSVIIVPELIPTF